jgi:diguanylate cyclase (GGDEF)-like protein
MALLAPQLFSLLSALFYEPSHWLQLRPQEGFVMPLALAGLFLGVFALGVLLLLWRNDDAEVAILGTLVAGFIVFACLHLDYISTVMLSAAGLLQLSGVLRSSHTMVYRDELTGLLGRRALNEKLKGLGSRYTLAMLDVDHFKKFNDTHGHDVGDDVLKMVASRLARVGAGGTAFRYGGEEFCIVFPRRSAEQCLEALENLREGIEHYHMTLRDSGARPVKASDGARRRGSMATKVKRGTVSVTISIGVAERSDASPTPEDVIKAADQQLYRAKKAGRNRVCSA